MPRKTQSTPSDATQSQDPPAALRVLVRLLARAAARELLAASQRQPAASPDQKEDA